MINKTIISELQSNIPPTWGGTVIYTGLFIFLPLALVGIGLAVLWNIANYTRFKKYLSFLGDSVGYVFIGIVSLIVLSLPMGFIYWGYTNAKAGNTVPLIWTGVIILAYILLALIGWFVKRYVIERVQKFEQEYDYNEVFKEKSNQKEKVVKEKEQ